MTDSRRTALVTGAAGGIGLAIATLLHRRGLRVVLADRDPAVVERAARFGAEALVIDITDEGSLEQASALPRLDVLVNSAAIAAEAAPDAPGIAGILSRTLDVNVVGMARVVAAVLPQLRASTAARILTIGSVQATAAAPGNLPYVASKGAVDSLTRALAVDLAPDGILVNGLAPGFVDTAMAVLADGRSEYETAWFRSVYIEHGGIPLRRPARPDEIAAAAEFFVSEQNTYVTGVVLPVDGGLLAAL